MYWELGVQAADFRREAQRNEGKGLRSVMCCLQSVICIANAIHLQHYCNT